MTAAPKVFIVDDDHDIRLALQRLFAAAGLTVELFASAEQYLATGCTSAPGCLLLDVRMPGMGGMQLLEVLKNSDEHHPVILLTAHGDIPMVLRALKAGVLDFIEKPPNHQVLLDAVYKAFAFDREMRAKAVAKRQFLTALATLTPREREVLGRIVDGVPNKVIASELGISARTLEKHREHIIQKMHVRSLAELIHGMVQHGQH
ncbi:MAG: response regulator [Methylococcaceae bacterium]|nr:response regulator [Methylococcaceae bacterium]